jgi:hypothetical protein
MLDLRASADDEALLTEVDPEYSHVMVLAA